MASPTLQHVPSTSRSTEPPFESPLRKSFSAEQRDPMTFNPSQESLENIPETMVDEDGATIHIDPPSRRASKVHGGAERDTEDLGPHGGNTEENGGWVDEQGYGVPILASDEVAKEDGAEYMQPAVSPHRERRDSSFHDFDFASLASGSRTPTSRPGSRPGSIHGGLPSLSRFTSRVDERDDLHTPLEDVEEYEPLFPDEEDGDGKKKPLTAADRFKARPDTLKRRFPSQDIWEDTPNSLMHVTTVSTPDLPQESQSAATPSSSFETPEAEAARKGEVSEAEKKQLLPKEVRLANSRFAPHLRSDMGRPGMQQRFPSRDIWEDSPDSMNLVTTVQTPPSEEAKSPPEIRSPPDVPASKPTIPPRPTRTKVAENATEPSVQSSQPAVPGRPPKRLHQVPPVDAEVPQSPQKQVSPIENKKVPVIPERPKPQVPVRPAKAESTDMTNNLTKSISATSAGSTGSSETKRGVTSPPLPKTKPTIPARPAGSKIAALQAGFMSDLNKRLQVGPKAVEKEAEPEPDVEKALLNDARKGRARGPQRRKPAASPGVDISSAPSSQLAIAPAWSVFEVGDDNELAVHVHKREPMDAKEVTTGSSPTPASPPAAPAAEEVPPVTKAEVESQPRSMASSLATNTAGEPTDPSAQPPPSPAKADAIDVAAVSRQSTTESLKSPIEAISKVSKSGSRQTGSDAKPELQATGNSNPSVAEDPASSGDAGQALSETPARPGAGPAKEPTPTLPQSLSEKDLEEMTTKADGKVHAAEEPEALRQESAS